MAHDVVRPSVVTSSSGRLEAPLAVSSFHQGLGQLFSLFHPPVTIQTLPAEASTRTGFQRVGQAIQQAMMRRAGGR